VFERRGVGVTDDLYDESFSAVLLSPATRHVRQIVALHRNGVRIVQRLDGINWRHRVEETPLRSRIIASGRNRLMAFLRHRVSDRIVYQSDFVHRWWEEAFGPTRAPWSVIRNGVDLNDYQPAPRPDNENTRNRQLICVEGNLPSDRLTISSLIQTHRELLARGVIDRTVLCVGNSDIARGLLAGEGITIRGPLAAAAVREELGRSDVFLSLEVNPACPNAVIEALATGLPVCGFATGGLAEVVAGAGRLVPFGGDPWRLEPPNNGHDLALAVEEVTAELDKYRRRARSRAEEHFDIEDVAERYLQVLFS